MKILKNLKLTLEILELVPKSCMIWQISKVNLLSNSEQKHRVGLSGYGLSIVDYTNY